jgi:inorganic pyrophosphatase
VLAVALLELEPPSFGAFRYRFIGVCDVVDSCRILDWGVVAVRNRDINTPKIRKIGKIRRKVDRRKLAAVNV